MASIRTFRSLSSSMESTDDRKPDALKAEDRNMAEETSSERMGAQSGNRAWAYSRADRNKPMGSSGCKGEVARSFMLV